MELKIDPESITKTLRKKLFKFSDTIKQVPIMANFWANATAAQLQ